MAVIGTTNVLVADIRDVLLDYGGTVTNDTTTFFTAAAKINHWAKYKPVRYEGDFPSYDDYWKAHDGNCGFTPLQLTSYASVPNYMDGEMNGWTYNLPTGGSTYPYRLGDFRGYNPEAQAMVGNFYAPSQASNQFEGNTFTCTAIVPAEGSDSVTLADLALSDYYAAVYIVKNDGTSNRVAIGNSLSGGTFTVEVECDDLSAGEYTIYPFISRNSSTGVSGERFYTIPNLNTQVIKIISSYVTIVIAATKLLDNTKISYTISVINDSAADITMDINAVYCRLASKDISDALVDGELITYLSDGLVAKANATTSIAFGQFNVTDSDVYRNAKIWVTLDEGKYIASTIPMSGAGGQE